MRFKREKRKVEGKESYFLFVGKKQIKWRGLGQEGSAACGKSILKLYWVTNWINLAVGHICRKDKSNFGYLKRNILSGTGSKEKSEISGDWKQILQREIV